MEKERPSKKERQPKKEEKPEKEKKSHRIDWLDRVKGIGILFVVIGHVYVEDGFTSRMIHGLNVPLFFVASGYLMGVKREWERAGKELFLKKSRDILRPYFFYSGVVMLWLFFRLAVFGYGSRYELLHCLADIFCLEGISVLWFLSALFFGEIFVLFLTALPSMRGKNSAEKWPEGDRKEMSWLLLLLLLFFSGAALLSWLTSQPWAGGGLSARLLAKLLRILARGLAAAVFMMFGILLQNIWQNAPVPFFVGFRSQDYSSGSLQRACRKIGILFLLMMTASGLWINGLRDFHYLSFGNFPLYFCNGFLGFVAIAGISQAISWDKLFKFLGKNSLVIMATHLILLDFINIMAVLLSPFAGRYLGDELGMKLAAVAVGEAFILMVRIRWRNGKNRFLYMYLCKKD